MTTAAEDDQKKAMTLHKVAELCERQLLNLFHQLLDRADTVFFDLAHVASPKEQQGLFDTMRVLRLQRQALENEFKHQLQIVMARMPEIGVEVSAPRSSIELSLMDDEDLTDNIAFDAMVQQTLVHNENRLQHLLMWYQFAYGSYAIQLEWLPMHPAQLGNVVRKTFKQLNVSARVMTIMYQLFEREVLSNIGGVIMAATNLFNDAENVGKQIAASSNDEPAELKQLSDEEQQQVNDYLHELYAHAQQADAQQAPSINTEQLVSGLSRIQQNISSSGDNIVELRDVLSNVLNAGQEKLGVLNTELIKLVCDMFANVLSAKSLSGEFRQPISRLQLPLLKTALQQQELFTDREHPARQLINEIAHAGLGFDPVRRGNDVVLAKVNSMVAEITSAARIDTAMYEKWLTDFQVCLREEYRRSLILERRLNETEEGKARTEAAKRAAEQALKPLLNGKRISDEMLQLLNEVWRRLLQLEHVRAHGVSEAFRHYQVTAELLLQSVDRNLLGQKVDRKTVSEQVRQELREGFEAMGLPAVDITQWLSRVAHEHEKLSLLDQVEQRNAALKAKIHSAKVVESDAHDSAAEHIATDVLVVTTSTQDDRKNAMGAATESLQITVAEEFLHADIDIKAMEQRGIAEEIWHLVDSLPVPSWLLKQNEDGTGLRCKLAAKITSIGRYIFVNRTGIKVLDLHRDEVAAAFADGSMSMIDDCALFDRALSDVIANLRSLKDREDSTAQLRI